MKYVFKGTEPASFTNWKALANDQWLPAYADLQNPEKRALHQSLLTEQGHVCCYCGRRISLENSHIEHFRPQERYANVSLDYSNLFASCLRTKSQRMPLHCGHQKANWFDEHIHIMPTNIGCERRFRFLLNGSIEPTRATDKHATQMLEVLALDIAFLKNRRAQTLLGIFDDDFLASATREELKVLIEALRTLDNGIHPDFGHVAARYAEQLVGK